ncbi:hypothetical protein [Bifidobacterium sp. ESL0745]|uniref:hypothetical protein n=1 Tax=Bifidobacterium sp. ESL0745 TaxID=2983226 RepID=UPI0023F8F1CA|nr:hypothetical protein [Bifidobacterium sp. ESL0745]MDF7664799.1 hypothetical protein [Bifidobacterium sp. ESL0745]
MVKVSVILPSIKIMSCLGKLTNAAASNPRLEVLAKNPDIGTYRLRVENSFACGPNVALAHNRVISVAQTVGVDTDDE